MHDEHALTIFPIANGSKSIKCMNCVRQTFYGLTYKVVMNAEKITVMLNLCTWYNTTSKSMLAYSHFGIHPHSLPQSNTSWYSHIALPACFDTGNNAGEADDYTICHCSYSRMSCSLSELALMLDKRILLTTM